LRADGGEGSSTSQAHAVAQTGIDHPKRAAEAAQTDNLNQRGIQ
jgi:hypothetical protein